MGAVDIDVIATSEVLLFQSRDKYTAVITADKERYIRTPMKDLLNVLDPDEFWQVHRSSVIQVAAIEPVMRDDVGRMQVKMRDGKELVPVSAAFSGRFKQRESLPRAVQPVAFGQPQRDVELDGRAELAEDAEEDGRAGHAVHVVVAVDADAPLAGNCLCDAFGRFGHAR